MDVNDRLTRLDEVFGLYRDEWLKKDLFKFFSAPIYYNDLQNVRRPCVLQGGRGSGKTTVLRGLSYMGQYDLNGRDISKFDAGEFIGIYFKAYTNHVRVFQGRGISEDRWISIFGHYFNLLITRDIVDFLLWHSNLSPGDEELPDYVCEIIASSLHANGDVKDTKSLFRALDKALIVFQSSLNNLSEDSIPLLSLAGDPIQRITEQALRLRQFEGKTFFLLVDEYENLLESQQLLMNTLLKHTPDSYTFKIGVRSMGWKVKTTLNKEEVLNDPADYVLLDIAERFSLASESAQSFSDFARNVCELRLSRMFEDEFHTMKMMDILQSMTIEEEALYWGVKNHRYYLEVIALEGEKGIVLDIHPLYKFFLDYWAVAQRLSLEETIKDFLDNRAQWDTRYNNYKYSLLFKIKTGRGRGVITKYYGGWNTLVKLANGNIRYLLELVHESFYIYLQNGGDLSKPISLEFQTKAAKNVGWKNLSELESAYENGSKLTRMVQSIGTVFGALAKDGDNLAPEIVQFEIQGELKEETRKLLTAGVMNMALVRMSANKLSSLLDVREFMYSLHPIFAPFFNFSFRKKRKLPISEDEFWLCIDNQKDGVASILKRKNFGDISEYTELLQMDDIY